jgi:hypothetical protein
MTQTGAKELKANLTSRFSNMKSVYASPGCRNSGQGTSPRGMNVGSKHGKVAGVRRNEERVGKTRLSDTAEKTETGKGDCAIVAANMIGGRSTTLRCG